MNRRLALSAVPGLLVALGTSPSNGVQVVHDPMDVRPLTEGMPVPEALVVKNHEGGEFDLTAALNQEPTILIFYRGGWCPFCSTHLGELQSVREELEGLGFRVLAVSPDRPQKAKEGWERIHGELTLLSDSPMIASSAFGLSFRVSDDLLETYRGYGIDLEADSGMDHHLLPVPAAFVIVDGVIRFAYVNPDYKTRVNVEVLLAAARTSVES